MGDGVLCGLQTCVVDKRAKSSAALAHCSVYFTGTHSILSRFLTDHTHWASFHLPTVISLLHTHTHTLQRDEYLQQPQSPACVYTHTHTDTHTHTHTYTHTHTHTHTHR